MPYIDGTPAGTKETVTVLWDRGDKTIFAGARLSRCYDQLVEELAGPFHDPRITNALRACMGRDKTFIDEYFNEHFLLSDPECPLDQSNVADQNADEKEAGELVPIARLENMGDEDEVEEAIEVRHRRRDKIFEVFRCYAEAQGFQWDELQEIFKHRDGSILGRSDPPFHWQHRDREGRLVRRYWVAPRVAAGIAGQIIIECPAEVFEAIRTSPEAYSVLIELSEEIYLLSGSELIKRIEREDIEVFPARYRLVFCSGLEQGE